MPVEKRDYRLKVPWTADQYEDLRSMFEEYWVGLGAEPIIGIGRHHGSGGLLVIPWFDGEATPRDVIDILEEALAYCAKAWEKSDDHL